MTFNLPGFVAYLILGLGLGYLPVVIFYTKKLTLRVGPRPTTFVDFRKNSVSTGATAQVIASFFFILFAYFTYLLWSNSLLDVGLLALGIVVGVLISAQAGPPQPNS